MCEKCRYDVSECEAAHTGCKGVTGLASISMARRSSSTHSVILHGHSCIIALPFENIVQMHVKECMQNRNHCSTREVEKYTRIIDFIRYASAELLSMLESLHTYSTTRSVLQSISLHPSSSP
jgi:hypothetical protein